MVHDEYEIDGQYNNYMDLMMRRLNDLIHKGSSCTIKQVSGLELHLVSYKPVSASSYIKTPKFIAKKCGY